MQIDLSIGLEHFNYIVANFVVENDLTVDRTIVTNFWSTVEQAAEGSSSYFDEH